jgi:hypothetical protein
MLQVYRSGDSLPYIGKIHIKSNINSNVKEIQTIILLDTSGSMGQNVGRIITQYLPESLQNNNNNNEIILITFSGESKVFKHNINSLRKSRQGPEGQTFMEPAITNLQQIIRNSEFTQFNILTISDGALHDQDETISKASLLKSEIEGKYQIKSSAIRLYTSSSEPDTRGLSSILQLDTTNEACNIVDVNTYNTASIIDAMTKAFKNDNIGGTVKLCVTSKVLMESPYNRENKDTINLVNGENIFWLSDIENLNVFIMSEDGNEIVNIVYKDNLNLSVLSNKVEHYMKKLKLLKVIGTNESIVEIKNIVNYFQKLEDYINLVKRKDDDIDINANTNLKTRLKFFRVQAEKQSKSVVQQMANIANDDKVSLLNSAQQANYLRSVTTSTNSINLAKRGIKQGLDFDSIVQSEVRKMKKHLHELNDIDDTNHYVSFYNQETTLDGIKTVCSEGIDQLCAEEILKLLNIVGIPCTATVGDYPDPKTYHIHNLLLGSHVSISDIITVKSLGEKLLDPYTKKEIINVVPVYNDDRIQQFLMKYAPTLLEYTASLGIRNMIVDIPHSYKYIIVGGVYLLSRLLQDIETMTEANATLFIDLVETYKTAVNGIFDHVLDHIVDQKKDNLSYYICNNGTTNMISPLISIVNTEKSKYVPDILRALYSFEFYQVIRKFNKSDSDGASKRKEMLNTLLGIDVNKYGSPLPELFETQNCPKHHCDYHINDELFTNINNKVFWIDYICLIPKLIDCALTKNKDAVLNLAKENLNKNKENLLNIDFDLKTFKLFCIVQSFIFDTQASRVDKDNNKMKIQDCGNHSELMEFINDYICKQYHSDYQSRLAEQNKLEHEILMDELINQMCKSNINEFINLFKNGIIKGNTKVIIEDVYKSRNGYTLLQNQLFNINIDIKDRIDKLWIFILGSTKDDDVIWNNGNVLKLSPQYLEDVLTKLGLYYLWKEIYPIYKEKSIHLYRENDLKNRHSHRNSKPSYWARGYKNLGEYFDNISIEEQQEYCRIHTHCCGIWDGKVYRSA